MFIGILPQPSLQATKTSCDTTTATQKLAWILYYLDGVCTAYIACARQGNVADEEWFSPELEYHMWLDFVKRAYHNDACASIEERVGVTLEYVVQREQPNISSFIKWDKYIEMHNLRFNMCGLEIPLEKDEPHVPQAAHRLAKAILDDLEEADKKNKGKQKARGTLDEAEEVGRKTKRMRGSTKMKDKVEVEIRVKTQKPAREKRPPVEEDGSASDSEMVVDDSQGAEYELDDEDAITLQAINAEEKQDRRSSKQKYSRRMRHNSSPGMHKVIIAGANVWNERFGQLYTFICTRLLRICDIDIDKIHDDDALHAWHQSINRTHSNSSEILGYVLILRSTAKLEQGIHSDLQLIMSSIGNKEYMIQYTEDQNGKAQQSEWDKVQEDSQRGNSGDEGQIDNGRTQVEVDDEICMERPYEMVMDQALQ
ncbi:hypothetical protein L210DRAFT_3502081 [Boletus edulis BED1]|uniref:Uncharacterized protein n=1 Tax=Boletus edulis BED1 TaxID=1328754 RepID=A0AAD4BZG7_BOLED|nr:hypothetical protein L210DRAFT_3502081 [Boletus edulis BED1]